MQYYHSIPSTGFMRLPAVLAVIPVSKSTWWAGVKSGRFPKPVKLGVRTTAWRAEDIRDFIEQPTSTLESYGRKIQHSPQSD